MLERLSIFSFEDSTCFALLDLWPVSSHSLQSICPLSYWRCQAEMHIGHRAVHLSPLLAIPVPPVVCPSATSVCLIIMALMPAFSFCLLLYPNALGGRSCMCLVPRTKRCRGYRQVTHREVSFLAARVAHDRSSITHAWLRFNFARPGRCIVLVFSIC